VTRRHRPNCRYTPPRPRLLAATFVDDMDEVRRRLTACACPITKLPGAELTVYEHHHLPACKVLAKLKRDGRR
jgi:hypothetical protein